MLMCYRIEDKGRRNFYQGWSSCNIYSLSHLPVLYSLSVKSLLQHVFFSDSLSPCPKEDSLQGCLLFRLHPLAHWDAALKAPANVSSLNHCPELFVYPIWKFRHVALGYTCLGSCCCLSKLVWGWGGVGPFYLTGIQPPRHELLVWQVRRMVGP